MRSVSGIKNKNTINILWTGGWDSTYRLVELSRKTCSVQPIYVYGDNRPSERYEIRAMEKILIELDRRLDTKAHIFPIKFINKKSIPANEEITEAYNLIFQEIKLGSQHEWLARLSFHIPGLEIGTEKAPIEISRILTTIDKYGGLIKAGNGYVIDPMNSSKEVMLVLGNFRFPIIDKSGQDMQANIQSWGYEDIMRYVWFCHSPILGKPCGFCHPCELKIETGMEFLFVESPIALKRYARRNRKTHIISKIERKVSRGIEKIMSRFLPTICDDKGWEIKSD